MSVRSALLASAVALLAAPSLRATEFAELQRLEPVASTEQIPVIDFFRPPLFDDVQLNHPGTQIGAIVPSSADHTNLITYNLVTQKIDGISAPSGDKDISTFTWLNGDQLTYVVSQNKFAGGTLFRGEGGKLATGEAVFPPEMTASATILGNPPEDRNQLLVDLTGDQYRYDHPEIISVANHGELVTRYPELKTDHGFNVGFWPDKLGHLAFGVTQQDGTLSLSLLVGDTWVKGPEDLDQIDPEGAGDQPGELMVLGPRDGTGPRALELVEAATGKVNETLLQDRGYDFDGWVFRDPLSHNIVGAVYDRAAPHVTWFTESYRNLQKLVDGLFPGQVVRIQAMDDAGKMLLITSGSDRQPVIYSWVDLEHHKSGLIKNSAPWIDPKRMRPMGIIKYATAEGRQMDAYITLPAGASKQNPPPMVVIPHANSGGRTVWGFDAEVQFFASRGYAVLQPNYRGSAGYTWMFPEEESWDFRKMADDVAAATRKAVELGFADKGRVAILGTDFGGYLAQAGAALEPGLYKCAVSISAFSDWGRYINADKYQQFTDANYSRFLRKLGDPGRDAAKFDAMSPLAHAGAFHSALLVSWGEFDNPEMISQSKDIASAVERNGVPVERMSFLEEADGVRHLDHKIELYQHIQAFLAKNL